jgi:hypothetical protein
MRAIWLCSMVLILGAVACGSSGSGDADAADVAGQEVAGEAFVIPDVPAGQEAEIAVLPSDTATGDDAQPEATSTYPTCSALLFQCVLACDEANAGCEDACKAQADAAAAAQWDALAACGQDDCPADMDQAGWVACFGETCVAQFGACVGGTKKCKEVRGCAGACAPDDVGCVVQCLAQGTDDAKGLFSKLYTCVQEQCGDKTDPLEYQACVDSAYGHECANHLNACEPM